MPMFRVSITSPNTLSDSAVQMQSWPSMFKVAEFASYRPTDVVEPGFAITVFSSNGAARGRRVDITFAEP